MECRGFNSRMATDQFQREPIERSHILLIQQRRCVIKLRNWKVALVSVYGVIDLISVGMLIILIRTIRAGKSHPTGKPAETSALERVDHE